MVTLSGGIKPKNGESTKACEVRLKEMIEKQGGDHLCYDAENLKWTFSVPNFA